MNRITKFVLAAGLVGAAVLFAIPLVAQETTSGDQAASANGDATPDLTIAGVEAALAAIEADTGLEDAAKDQLRSKYKQAIDALKEAAGFATQATAYRDAIQTAPETAAALRAELQALPSTESAAKITATGSADELQKDVELRRAALNGLSDELSKTTSGLARVNGRPGEISARLPAAQRELSEIRRQLASPELVEDATSPGRVADRILLEANQSRLLSELEMLAQEQSSLSVREDQLRAQQELLLRQGENATAALRALEALLHRWLTGEAERIRWLADTLPQDVPDGDKAAQALVAEVQGLAMQFEEVIENLKRVRAAHDDITAQRERLSEEHESIQEQLKLGGGGGAMAQVLFDLGNRVVNARADVLAVRLPTHDETRLAAFRVDEKLREQPKKEKEYADHPSRAVKQLITTRREVLDRLRTQYGSLTRALAVFDGDKKQFFDKSREIRRYIWEQLFWMRSSPPISLKTLADLPGGLGWLFGADHWLEFGSALRAVVERLPLLSVGIVFAVAVLLIMRWRIGTALDRTGLAVRRISTDRYAHTVEALVWTSLLAIPIPLLLGFAGWALEKTPEPSEWLRGFTDGLRIAAWVTMVLGILATVCRPGGLGAAHFGWRKEKLARLRSATQRFTLVYIPALLLTSSCFYEDASQYLDSPGRISWMLAHVWAAIVLWRLFHGAEGIFATLTAEYPTRLITRWRYLWFTLLLACPLVLVVLAGLGYLITSIELSLGLLVTVALIAGGSMLYGLALRWFTMKQRKLALAEALDRRRARQEAAAEQEEAEPSGEVITVDPEDEAELDLDAITLQTRHLLQLLFGLAVIVAIIVYWSGTFPLITALDAVAIPLTAGLTLLGLAQIVLILATTYIAVQNLPGVLELAVLRATSIEAGTRNAIYTLCQYGVIAIGLVALFNVLQVDWAKFGWIAAAFSVGLGFGLQEVVANFVCGLILLFERPIRVGDVVTVDGVTGTVTKIHMRATTITNWDREEFVVPNKTLITSPLLNLTLSSPLNRIVITVGVAYGSDTEKARQILLDVAAQHPLILDDPPPMAAFEQFADSTLNLTLRAFLPDRENRIGAITELHTEIDKRFAAAGIEIAFPQRDLHVRSGWEGAGPAGAPEGATEGE